MSSGNNVLLQLDLKLLIRNLEFQLRWIIKKTVYQAALKRDFLTNLEFQYQLFSTVLCIHDSIRYLLPLHKK